MFPLNFAALDDPIEQERKRRANVTVQGYPTIEQSPSNLRSEPIESRSIRPNFAAMAPPQQTPSPTIDQSNIPDFSQMQRDNTQAAYAPYMAPPRPMPQVTQHSGGFGSRLKDTLMGMGLGALHGGLGGALAGGIASGINPQLAHNMKYNFIDKPGWEHDVQVQQAIQKHQLGQIHTIAGITGVDPVTGQPTEQAQERDATIKDREAGRQAQADYHQENMERLKQNFLATMDFKNNAQDAKENAFADANVQKIANGILSAYKSGATLGPDQYKALIAAGRISGPSQLPAKHDPNIIGFGTDGNGNMTVMQVGKNSGIIKSQRGAGQIGKPSAQKSPPSEMQLEQEAERQARSESGPKPTQDDIKHAKRLDKNADPVGEWQNSFNALKEQKKQALRSLPNQGGQQTSIKAQQNDSNIGKIQRNVQTGKQRQIVGKNLDGTYIYKALN